MHSFTDLLAWQTGMALVKEIYEITRQFPKEELYGMTSQLRRASTSILANLAEGCGRYTYVDKANKFTISRGECTEVKAFILIAISLGLVTKQRAEKAIGLADETGKMISGLIKSCKTHS